VKNPFERSEIPRSELTVKRADKLIVKLIVQITKQNFVAISQKFLIMRYIYIENYSNMSRVKVTIVGAGNVGANVANILALKGVFDVALVDIDGDLAKGKSLDIQQQCALVGSDSRVEGSNEYRITENSSIGVITAGITRKPGMKREDLLKTNAQIVKGVVENLKKYSPDMTIIVVTNPVDTMAYLAYKVSNLPRNKVIGMGGVLDTARFMYFIKEKLNVSYNSIKAMVIGEHGDGMIPLISLTYIGNKPIGSLLSEEEIGGLIKRTQQGGAEIVSLLKTGSAFYAPAMSVVRMVESIVFDKKEVLPCSVMCQGEYGVEGIYLGLPAKLGKDGVEEIVEIALDNKEKEMLKNSARSLKNTINQLNGLVSLTSEGNSLPIR
jgi:malate dehydrogenase